MTPRPLFPPKKHGAVFNGDFNVPLLGIANDRRPDFFKQRNIFLHIFCLIPADKGSHQINVKLCAGINDLFEMGNIGAALFKVPIHGIGIKGQRGNLHIAPGAIFQNVCGFFIGHCFHIDMTHPGVSAFPPALRPAGNLYTAEAHFGGRIDHLFKTPAVENRAYKP